MPALTPSLLAILAFLGASLANGVANAPVVEEPASFVSAAPW